MNDYERLRKALGEAIKIMPHSTDVHLVHDPESMVRRFEEIDQLLTKALSSTAKTSEMERLREWLPQTRTYYLEQFSGRDGYDKGYLAALRFVENHIKSEFGYGGEDAES